MMASGNEARRKLTLARDSLIQDLSPIPFLDQLIHREVVEPGEAVVDRTTAAMRQLGRTDAVRLLLDDYLQRKVAVDPSILDQLIDSLEASNQKHLAELLRRPVPPPVQAGATPGNDTTFTAVQPTGMDELDSCPPKDVAAGSELYDLSKELELGKEAAPEEMNRGNGNADMQAARQGSSLKRRCDDWSTASSPKRAIKEESQTDGIMDRNSAHHISKWMTSDIAQRSLVKFLCDRIGYEEMCSLADVALGTEGLLNSGQRKVDNGFSISQDREPKNWLATMINLWAKQGPGNESVLECINLLGLENGDTICEELKRLFGGESEPVPASDQSIGVPVSGADASDWTSPAQAAAGSSKAVAGAGHEIIYVDPNWSFDQDHRLCLIAHHSASWEILARGLKNAATGAPAFANAGNQIAELKKDCDSTKERMAKLLDDWQQLTKKHDKVIHLIQAFRDIGESSAANDLIAKSQKASPESSQPTSIAVAETGGPGYH
ncbi:uncharacterized protein LOC135808556 isoform X2 [Sycon ciliatum]|uniref:uncharacterized protein LOC135808556 isoform X2 n=1 Tax=Sycon ciliatum TaxID=27933 RepID=UPI0031F62F81